MPRLLFKQMPFCPLDMVSLAMSGLEDLEQGLLEHESNGMCSSGGKYLLPRSRVAHLQEACHIWSL